MADGRMLKRNISDSRRLAELKTDSARLLWTWIMPYLDKEGRFFSSPDLIKGKVVPRLKTFTEENIEGFLQDMAYVGLIALYEVDGERYLTYRNFDKFQKIRKDREGSPLPGPKDGTTIKPNSNMEDSRRTPGTLLEDSGNTPPQVKLREVKRSKDKEHSDTGTSKQPVDNLKPKNLPLKKEPPEEWIEEINEACFNVQKLFPMNEFNLPLFMANHRPTNGNEEAHMKALPHALNQIVEKRSRGEPFEKSIYGYVEYVYMAEIQNYNAGMFDAKQEQYKDVGDLKAVGNILKQVGLTQ